MNNFRVPQALIGLVASFVIHAGLPVFGGRPVIVPEAPMEMTIVEFTAPATMLDEAAHEDADVGSDDALDALTVPSPPPVVAPRVVVPPVAPPVVVAAVPPVVVPPAAPVVEPLDVAEAAAIEVAPEPTVPSMAAPSEIPPVDVTAAPTLSRERVGLSRDEIRRRRLAIVEKRRQARAALAAREAARKNAPSRPVVDKVIPEALKVGDADEIWACEDSHRGIRAEVKTERPITDWTVLAPTLLFAYPTTPSLGDYLEGVAQVTKRRRRHVAKVGKWEFAMPRGEIEVVLAEPLGVRAYLGRDDARCLVGFDLTKDDVFPIELKRVPIRVVDGNGHEARSLVNLTFHKDARFDIAPVNDRDVPFLVGQLDNASLIERTIDTHFGTARTFVEVASFFGFDVKKLAAAEQKRRAKALADARKDDRTARRDGPR